MFSLRDASIIIVIVVCAAAFLLLGDYIGYKFGRMKLATSTLFTTLGLIIIFAIYAVVYSTVK